MIRVLIADDSRTAREALRQILVRDPAIEIVGAAKDGAEALRMVKELHPDLVTMDLQMPAMDGLQATEEIMIEQPTPIVIVSSSSRLDEVEIGMRALKAGALTLLRKPMGPGEASYEKACREMISTVKAMADVHVIRRRRSRSKAPRREVTIEPPRVQAMASTKENPRGAYRAIAIAASTGGPPALQQILARLPHDYPLPILVVQHIATGFVNGFANWLNSVVTLTVKVVDAGETMNAGTVYIAPEERHLGVGESGRLNISDSGPIDGFRPAANYLFQSLSRSFGAESVAVILTGMGKDGVDGMRAVHQAGGLTIAQDEHSSVIFGMPRVAIEERVARKVLSTEQIGRQLLELTACETT